MYKITSYAPKIYIFFPRVKAAFYVETHRNEESVTVRNFIVDDGLEIYSLQLELYGDINEPE